MEQYISKSALVKEIKRYKHKADERLKIKGRTLVEDHKDFALQNLCGNLLYFIDTLEVKEIDLEKEINKYISNNFFGSQTLGFFANRTEEEPDDQDIALCAKHFFELGMSVSNKAQKEE